MRGFDAGAPSGSSIDQSFVAEGTPQRWAKKQFEGVAASISIPFARVSAFVPATFPALPVQTESHHGCRRSQSKGKTDPLAILIEAAPLVVKRSKLSHSCACRRPLHDSSGVHRSRKARRLTRALARHGSYQWRNGPVLCS